VQAQLKPHRLERYLASDDRISKPRRRTSLGCTWIRPSMRLCFAWTKRPRFRLWIGWIRCCRCLRVGGTTWFRVLPPWHPIVICRLGREDGQSGRQDGEAPYQRGVHCLSEPVAQQGSLGEANSHRAGQSVGTQDQSGGKSFWHSIRKYIFTSRLPIRPG